MKTSLLLSCVFAAAFAHGAVTLFDFETDAEIKAAPRVRNHNLTVCVSNAFATSGSHALYFKSGPWKKGRDEWPSFNLHTDVKDWRGYDRLVFDLASIGEGADSFNTFICGPTGPVQNGLNANITLPPRSFMQWVVPLKKWPKTCDPSNIGRVHLFLDKPRDMRVFIDRITLLKKGEPLPVPSGEGVARDLLPFLSRSSSEALALKNELSDERAHVRAYCDFREACARAGQDASAFCVGTASSMTKVMPRGHAIDATPADELAVRLARSERESVQLIVAPGAHDLKNVRVKVTDLAGPNGATFPASRIACDVTGYVHTQRKPPYRVGCWTATNAAPGWVRSTRTAETGWWPDPILNFLDGVDIVNFDAQSFWLRVHCPDSQPAGVYTGTLTITADNAPSRTLPFRVRVNNFAVPKASPLPLAITFSPETCWTDGEPIVDDAKNAWAKHEIAWGDFLADYYITMDSLYHNGRIHWDVLTRLKEQGRLGRFNLGYWHYFTGGAPEEQKWRNGKVQQLKAAYAKAKELGLLDHAYVYGCDEIATNWFGNIRRCVDILKTELPGVPVSTTAYDHDFGVGTPLDVMDWFTPLTPKFDVEKAAKSRAAGHQVWWYICCGPHAPQANMFIECPAIEGRVLMGAQTTRMRPDGFLYYQISIWNAKPITSGPFTEWNPRSWTKYHGDGSWTCVGPDGKPLATVRLENFRDGLEDYAYALLLEEKMKAGGRSADWMARAKALLAVPQDVMVSMTQFTGDPAAVLRWRDAMADLIEE